MQISSFVLGFALFLPRDEGNVTSWGTDQAYQLPYEPSLTVGSYGHTSNRCIEVSSNSTEVCRARGEIAASCPD